MTTPRARRPGLPHLVLIGPFMLFLLATIIVPVGYAAYSSFFSSKVSGLGYEGPKTVFTGAANYVSVLTDPAFLSGLWHVACFAALQIPIMGGLAIGIALLLDSGLTWLRRTLQLSIFLPHAVPTVIAALIWGYLYTPALSPLQDFYVVDPFSPSGVLPAIVNTSTWEWVGYNMIIFFTALQTISGEVLESAWMDGAGAARTALSIKLPHLRGTVLFALIFSVIGALQLFTEPTLLRQFSTNVDSNYSPAMYVYSAVFVANNYGRGAAAAVILAISAAVASIAVMRGFSRTKVQE
jgi:multiple sugar transport system permease protein